MSQTRFRASLIILAALGATLAVVVHSNRASLICYAEGKDNPTSPCYVEIDRVLELRDKLHGIHWAASHARTARVQEILDARPELVNKRDCLGRTPLLLALLNHDNQTRDLLFGRGARTDLRDFRFRTPAGILKKQVSKKDYEDITGGATDQNAAAALLFNFARVDKLGPFRKIWRKREQTLGFNPERLEYLGYQLLRTAIDNNSLLVAGYLVENGVDPYKKAANNDWPALYYATELGKNDVAKAILEKDLRPELLTSGEGLVQAAIAYRNMDLYHYYLNVGADPNCVYYFGNDPPAPALIHFVQVGNVGEIYFLLLHHADVNRRDKSGRTPLDVAFTLGDPKVISILSSYGAREMNVPDALREAAARDRTDLLQLLFARDDFPKFREAVALTPGSRVATALHSAARSGAINTLEFLLSQGADLEARDENGRTPLLIAAEAGNYGMVDYLISRGADINSTDNIGDSALSEAAWKGFEPIVELLLGNGAWVDALPKFGTPVPQYVSPLHRAVASGNGEIVAQLIASGSVMIEIPLGVAYRLSAISWCSTPLQIAAANQDLFSVQLLLNAGADPNFPRLIITDQSKINLMSPLYQAIYSYNEKPRYFDVIELLLKKGADPNFAVDGHNAPVTLAVVAQDEKMLRALVAAGAKLSVQVDGGTLLHALAYGRVENPIAGRAGAIVDFLIDHGVKVDARDSLGNTALYVAGRDPELAAALIKRGASKKLAKTGKPFLD